MRTRAGQFSGRSSVTLMGIPLTLGSTRAHLCMAAFRRPRVVLWALRVRFAVRRDFWERVDLDEEGRGGERWGEGEEGRGADSGEEERVRAVHGVAKAGRVVVVKKIDMS